MNTEKTLVINSSSFEATVDLARKLGANMRGGEVVELISDLGGGKTAFVSGLAKGIGSADIVSSPSFTLNNIYQAEGRTINHYDLYRLLDPGVMRYEIAEAIADPRTIVAIEWAETVTDLLPTKRLTIELRPTTETERKISVTYPEEMAYLVEGVAA